ncbi:MAG: hypothetical protein KDM81_16165, partial [Verrucomicrobiae bacterium]|nr:hypothetical protein [Verrucomicrobiae bacterium]
MPTHTGGNRPQGRAGFARTELVIITATVSLLALLQAATLGALGPATGGAQCLANLRELTRAWQQYGLQEGQLPPNPGDGNTSPGRNWVPGVCGPRQGEEFNPEVLQDPGRSLLFPYLEPGDSAVFRCPADGRMGRYQGTDPALAGRMVPAARSYAMNAAVGTTTLNGIVFAPLDGPWLDNHHTHRRGQKWRTYARFDEIIDPAPANLAVLLGEDANSINDGSLGFGMETPEWIDWVSTRHSMSGGIAFADGHVGMHAWTDPRTVVRNGIVNRVRVPGSVDHAWLRDRISARIELDRPRILPPAPALGLNRMRLVWPAAGAPGHRLES